jgi:hypothetical protein
MCPKLIAAISVAKSNLPEPVGEFDLLLGFRWGITATMAIAAVLQIIITKKVFSPHGSV